MKRFWNTLLIILVFSLICVITCPDKEKHSEALMKIVNVALQSELSRVSNDNNDELVMFGAAIGASVAEFIIDKHLVVDNYFVCSIGRTLYKGEEKIVSVGVMNHVFTMSEKELLENLQVK